MAERFLYLTTTGHKSGLPRRIEIWFVGHAGRHYLVSERREACSAPRRWSPTRASLTMLCA
jgi:hypothetical protein